MFAGAGEADVAEAAFFVQAGFGAFVDGFFVGEHAVFDADHEDDIELEAFAGVEAHEFDGIVVAAVIERGEQGILSDVIGNGAFRVVLRPEGDGVDEFIDVAFAFVDFGGLFFFASFEMFVIVAALDGFGEGFGDGFFRLIESVDEMELADGVDEVFVGGDVVGVGAGGDEIEALHVGEVFDEADGFFADAALGFVDDAGEGGGVLGIGEEAEHAEAVADFGTVVEGKAAVDFEGDFAACESGFDGAGHVVEAEEDGDFVGGDVEEVDAGFDFFGDGVGFILGGVAAFEFWGLAEGGVGGNEVDGDAAGGVFDKRVGEGDDFRGGAIVGGEVVGFAASLALAAVYEFFDAFGIGAAPFVDGLVLIADGQDIVGSAGEQFDDFILGAVGVLVFVDLDEAPLVLEFGEEAVFFGEVGLRGFEEADGFREEAGEVGGIGGVKTADVFLDDDEVFGGHFAVVNALFEGFGGFEIFAPVVESDEELFESGLGEIDGGVAGEFLAGALGEEFLLIGGIENGHARGVAQRRAVAAEEFAGEGVKGTDFYFFADGVAAGDAFAHLGGSFVGEGEAEDLVRGNGAEEELSDTGGDGGGFAGAGAGDDEGAAGEMLSDFLLFGVEALLG